MPSPKQKAPVRWLSFLPAVVVAAVVVIGLAFILRSVPERVQTGQVALSSPIETPATEEIPTPFSDENVIVVPTVGPDGKLPPPPPTFTPFPTWTPRPTPTRRPGPTATALALPKPADTAQGYLLYAVPDDDNQFSTIWERSSVDIVGKLLPNSATQLRGINMELTYPQPSPDGAYILYVQPGLGAGVPYIYESSSDSIHPLFDHPTLFDEYNIKQFDQIVGLPFDWHPDSKHVLFWAWTTPYAGLWLVNIETGERTVIKPMQDPPPQGAAVSPDGQRIAYAIVDAGFTHVEVAFADGTLDKNISSINISRLFGWSPDGKQLLVSNAYRQTDTSNKGEVKIEGPLWLLNPDLLDLQPLQIPFITNWPFEARWSPDGRFVAAVGIAAGETFGCLDKDLSAEEAAFCMYKGTHIYVEDVENGGVLELSSGILPVWSPDGSKLAFLSNRTGNPEVWTIGVDGSDLQQVTFDGKEKLFSLAWITLGGANK